MKMTRPLIERPTYARIDLDALSYNLRSVRSFIGDDVRYMAVVKADAYGHGAVQCSRRLEADGVDWLSVALAEEALELRDAGIQTPILCLGGIWPGQEDTFIERNITPVVFNFEHAELMNAAAERRSKAVAVHLKIDTGMGRIGVPFRDLPEFVDSLKPFNYIKVDGVMTHFAAADKPSENEFTDEQTRRLYQSVEILRMAGYSPELIDLANSPGAIAHPQTRGNMVRLGGVIYGLGDDVLPTGIEIPDLRPVLSLHTRIAQIKTVPAGSSIGYGRTFVTARESRIATIPIGYHDGYRRGLSNRARVLINGQFAPVVGRVSMDWTVLDVTDVDHITDDNDVTLIGRNGDGEIRASELARLIDTISYEITCGLSYRIPRISHSIH